MRLPRLLLASALAALAARPAAAVKLRPDDPLGEDDDRLPIDKPVEVEISQLYDLFENTFARRPGDREEPPRAMNVNTLGEVPESSWFTNRIGAREMSVEELARGPRPHDGPDTSGPWTILRGKASGITPGFTMRDGRGDVYFVKFDPRRYDGLSSAADAIGAAFFHAIGYHVPANYVAYFRRDQLRVAEDATVRGEDGKKRRMTEADLDYILSDVRVGEDGRMRCAASLRLAGEPLGPFRYHGTRGDDPNDVFPHQHRRELRGLRVFSAWLNHDDSRSINTLDTFVREGERGHVRHHLIDFSSTLGSGSTPDRRIAPQALRAGNEYVFERKWALRSGFTFGLWDRPWRRVRYTVYPEVGRIEADYFQPHLWRPEYPNPAFERMRGEDAFWAARIVDRFTDERIRAVVRLGEIRDPAAEEHLVRTLIARRDKVVAHYFRQLNPLAEFRLEETAGGKALVFENLGERRGLGRVAGYEVQWFAFDNEAETARPLGPPAVSAGRGLALPPAGDEYLLVRIRTRSEEAPAWGKAVDVYLRGGAEIVGIEREE